MFKNETHNHPTEIEPFGGAATCLGGCIRDPLSGRSYVYQAMRVTGAGDPLTPFSETLPGKLPQKKICQVAAHGYSSYGNQIGLATGQVAEVYHPGYVAKRLEIGAVVAAAPRSNVFRGTPAPGDVILLIGGRTGRDGVGGATGSSKEHTDTALENSAEVQKGDAPTERKIQRLFRNPELTRKIKICNDFGAGGVSVAIGEIAPSLVINLDAVPKKYDGLDGTELAISESQERMAVCVDPIGNRLLHRRGRQGEPRMRPRRRRHRQRPPRHDLARQDHRRSLPRLPRHQRRPTNRQRSTSPQRLLQSSSQASSLLTDHRSLVSPQHLLPKRPRRNLRRLGRRGHRALALRRQTPDSPRPTRWSPSFRCSKATPTSAPT